MGQGICIEGSIKTLPVTALYWIVCLALWKWAFFFLGLEFGKVALVWNSFWLPLAPQLSEELLARASVLVTIDFHRKGSELWNLLFIPHVFGNRPCLLPSFSGWIWYATSWASPVLTLIQHKVPGSWVRFLLSPSGLLFRDSSPCISYEPILTEGRGKIWHCSLQVSFQGVWNRKLMSLLLSWQLQPHVLSPCQCTFPCWVMLNVGIFGLPWTSLLP